MQELRFDGRVAIVTGAGGNPGLGRSYAKLLASRGAKVVVNDLGVGPDGRGAVDRGGPEAVVREIVDDGGTAIPSMDSVASWEGAANIVGLAVETWGRVDIIINNAGIAPFALFDEISHTDIERVVGVHLMGQIWMDRAAWPHMVRQGFGRLINVSSSVPLMGIPYQSIYSAAKLGVVGLTRALAAEGKPHGIKANALLPHADTLAWQTMLEPQFSEDARRRGMVPDLVAPLAVWLAHESCSVSGKCLRGGGGAISEMFFSQTQGTPVKPHLTLEDVATNITQVLDHTGAIEYGDPVGEVPPNMVPKTYTTEARS